MYTNIEDHSMNEEMSKGYVAPQNINKDILKAQDNDNDNSGLTSSPQSNFKEAYWSQKTKNQSSNYYNQGPNFDKQYQKYFEDMKKRHELYYKEKNKS